MILVRFTFGSRPKSRIAGEGRIRRHRRTSEKAAKADVVGVVELGVYGDFEGLKP